MKSEFECLKHLLSTALELEILNISIDSEKESQNYYGCSFNIGNISIKYRKAKITPKKKGQFVTLWKRNSNMETKPLTLYDGYDYYIIMTTSQDESGCFIFPKNVLAENQILSTTQKEGKRGFRVYTEWDFVESKQAQVTQQWQILYFINFKEDIQVALKKIRLIVK